MEENSFWKEVFRLKYNAEQGGWFTKVPKGSHGVGYGKLLARKAHS